MPLLLDIRECFRSLTVLTEQTFDIAEGKLHIVRVLATEGPCSQAKVVRATKLDPASVSRHIATLEAEGMATRSASDDHRGMRIVTLTKKGQSWFEWARRTRLKLERALLKGVDERDLAAFSRVLAHIDARATELAAKADALNEADQ
ncbi:MAG: MarR family transcriptional regulator [Terricaulis sp.]